VEKFCPVCGRGYDSDLDVCEDDGERLVIVSEEPSMVGRELEGKYKITDELGEGGMGSVYLAYQSTMDREVAVKVLKRQYCQNKLAIKRFLREARAASKLAHPNTITVYDFGQTADGLLYMVMEKLNGRPLADIMDEEGILHPERAVHILAQVCDSLAEAHANGITHRDLKPENIFIEPKFGNPEHVKVLDFGIAKMTEEGNTQATATGMICGTPSYMSPEQAMGKEIDGRSDVYALGILLYEMLAADRPFDGDTAMEVMLKHLNEEPPKLPPEVQAEVPEALVELMHRMLAKRVEERPSDCQTLKTELQAAMGARPSSSHIKRFEGPKRERTPTVDAVTSFDKAGLGDDPLPKKRNWTVVAVAAAVLVIGGVAGFMAMSADEGNQAAASAAVSGTDGGEKAAAVEKDDPAKAEKLDKGADTDKKPESKDDAKAEEKPAAATPDKAAVVPTVATKAEPGAVAGSALRATSETGAVMKKNPPVEMVNLTITSQPPGSYVWDGKDLVGQTPLTIAKPKNSGTVKFKLTAEGFKDKQLLLGTVQSYTSKVNLVSASAAPVIKPQPTNAVTSNRKTFKKKRKKKKRSGGGIGTF